MKLSNFLKNRGGGRVHLIVTCILFWGWRMSEKLVQFYKFCVYTKKWVLEMTRKIKDYFWLKKVNKAVNKYWKGKIKPPKTYQPVNPKFRKNRRRKRN